MFMAILDVQVVASSLPTIQAALEIRPDQMSWLQTSYLIAEVVAIPLTGLLTRALTMRWLSVATLLVFTAASIGCAWSGSLASLLAWRVVQGLAGGLLIPQVFAAGFVLFPGRGQALATTIAGVLAVLAPTIGPFAGGWITDAYDWPWLFLINVAPGIAAAAIGAHLLPRETPEVGSLRKLDLAALAAMAAALACLELGLKRRRRQVGCRFRPACCSRPAWQPESGSWRGPCGQATPSWSFGPSAIPASRLDASSASSSVSGFMAPST
jgi:DHA2 family multidrug resistance protein